MNYWPAAVVLLCPVPWKQLRMETAAKPSTLRCILQQRCPRCRTGGIFRYSIFRGFPKMRERCAICDLKFEREPGYFLGAMYLSYGLGVLIMAPIALLLWSLTGGGLRKLSSGPSYCSCHSRRRSHSLLACCGSILTRPSIRSGHTNEPQRAPKR
jgi:hypothetical protein